MQRLDSSNAPPTQASTLASEGHHPASPGSPSLLATDNAAARSSSDEDGWPRSVVKRARPSVGPSIDSISSEEDGVATDAQRRRVLRQATLVAVCKGRTVDAADFYAPIKRRVSLTRELLMRPANVRSFVAHRRTPVRR